MSQRQNFKLIYSIEVLGVKNILYNKLNFKKTLLGFYVTRWIYFRLYVLNICFFYLKCNVNCIFENCTLIIMFLFFILLLNRYFKIKLGEITNILFV